MRIYFSGIGGVGIGPLAEIAIDAGHDVVGSDAAAGKMTQALESKGAKVYIGQTGDEIARANDIGTIDWFVHTSALPPDHPELVYCKDHNIKISKRDELLATIIRDEGLKLIAVAGTHGKTTTTGMLVWCFKQLGIPVSYSVGTTISYGPSGRFDRSSQFFVYECDEFDRNMLHFWPQLAIITSLDYDHFETYASAGDYRQAFVDFVTQTDKTLLWERDLRYLQQPDLVADYEAYDELMDLTHIRLAGDHNRHNAYLVERALMQIFPDIPVPKIHEAINQFPGTDRRFEKLADNLYSDYAHHPTEIAATLQMANEIADDVVVVYQPHQNRRQLQIVNNYKNAFAAAETVHLVPTFLSREDPSQTILTPQQIIDHIDHPNIHAAELDEDLWKQLEKSRQSGKLVLVMGAGTIDSWVRANLA